MRKISYAQSIREATDQLMERNKDVFLIGQGVTSPWYVGSTCDGLAKKFNERVIDTPISEAAITGAAIGASITKLRPILVHPRLDFMYLAMDQIINQAANWRYMFGGKIDASLVIRGIINRGGEQGAQHSQAIQAIFAHIPGLKVVMPATPYDAKGLLISAVYDGNPVIYIDDRWLYRLEEEVPEEMYRVPIGKADIKNEGKDITIVTVSYMVQESLKAAEELKENGISAEVIDLRTVKPLDKETILRSVRKTRRLVVVDTAWKSFGISAEISAMVSENTFNLLKAPIKRVSLPDIPAPASSALEKVYYPNKDNVIKTIKTLF